MKTQNQLLIHKLDQDKTLSAAEWESLIGTFAPQDARYAAELARDISLSVFGKKVYFRGIIEFSNYCKNGCYYCGINRANQNISRYRLTVEDILDCCREGYELGYRTFVLQGGEDAWFNDDRMEDIIRRIRENYPDCAITLSLGEREYDSFKRFYDAGADRYLLRHEAADEAYYATLHPDDSSFAHRMKCLYDLRMIGYQTGCGFMVGTPGQTAAHLAKDMMFIHDFVPHMIGIGPFIPHKDTIYREKPAGSEALSLFLLSLCRIMQPHVLLPATTALGTIQSDGRKLGVLAGCNVIMPNLSPLSVRKKYMLYNDKAGTNDDAKAGIEKLKAQMREIGYEISIGRGDYKKEALS